jgi:hypothetical protein
VLQGRRVCDQLREQILVLGRVLKERDGKLLSSSRSASEMEKHSQGWSLVF